MVIAVSAIAYAEVPTAADFAACNMVASDKHEGAPSASPRMDTAPPQQRSPRLRPDGDSASVATRDVAVPATSDPTGRTITKSDDAELQGIATDRADDPAYVAAYKACMRQRGF